MTVVLWEVVRPHRHCEPSLAIRLQLFYPLIPFLQLAFNRFINHHCVRCCDVAGNENTQYWFTVARCEIAFDVGWRNRKQAAGGTLIDHLEIKVIPKF